MVMTTSNSTSVKAALFLIETTLFRLRAVANSEALIRREINLEGRTSSTKNATWFGPSVANPSANAGVAGVWPQNGSRIGSGYYLLFSRNMMFSRLSRMLVATSRPSSVSVLLSRGQGLLAVHLLRDADPIESHVNAGIVLEFRIQLGRAGDIGLPLWA